MAVVVGSLKRWLPDNPAETVAVLAPRNERAAKIAEGLREAGIDCIELLHSTRSTRRTAQILRDILLYLANPTQPRYLAVFTVIFRKMRMNPFPPPPKRASGFPAVRAWKNTWHPSPAGTRCRQPIPLPSLQMPAPGWRNSD